jgi:RNA-binding protein
MNNIHRRKVKYLKACEHGLDPVVLIGKHGLSQAVLNAIDEVLLCHELIKIKFIDCKEERKELARQIVEKTGSNYIAMIGNVLIIYRQHPEVDKRQYELKAI